MYLSDKDENYSSRKMLGQQTRNNCRLYITERPPKFKLEIEKACNERGIITNTRNCEVRIFSKKADGTFYSQPIISVDSIESLIEVAAKKQSSSKAKNSTPQFNPFRSLFQFPNNFEKWNAAHRTGTKLQ